MKIECNNNFDEYTVEDEDRNANACMTEEENESVSMIHLKISKKTLRKKYRKGKKDLK